MSYFVVNFCELKACQHWRMGDKCAKNGASIDMTIKYAYNIHTSSVCEVRRQIDKYRLERMLEE